MQECEDTQRRLGRPRDHAEVESIARQVVDNYPKIVQMLSEVNDTMPMLFKVNDFLRTIDTKLGSPVNTFTLTVLHPLLIFQYSQVCEVMYEIEGKDRGLLFKASWKAR